MNAKTLFFKFKNFLLPMLLALGLSSAAHNTSVDNMFAARAAVEKKEKKAKKTRAQVKNKKAKATKPPKKNKAETKAKAAKSHQKNKAETKAKATKSHQRNKAETRNLKPAHDQVSGKDEKGRTIYVGPRGGHYYINDAGNKIYIKH